MVDDLLDFTRGRLGNGIPVQRIDADSGTIATDAVAEMKTAYPNSVLKSCSASGIPDRLFRRRVCPTQNAAVRFASFRRRR